MKRKPRNVSWFPPTPPIQNLRPSYALQPLPPMQNLRPSYQPCPNLINIPISIAASTAHFVDKKVIITLLGGRKLIGTMRSFDKHGYNNNIVLDGAVERIPIGGLYCDIPIGLSVIRWENLVIIGEMDSQIVELPPMQNLRPPPSFQPLQPMQNLRPPPSFQPVLTPPPVQLINIPVPIAASNAHFLDKKVILMLLDDRKLIGTMRSYDKHGNTVLEGTVERKVVGDLYCDVLIGVCLIRGENLVLIGEMDSQTPELPPQMTLVSAEHIQRAEKVEKASLHIKSTMRKRMTFLDSD